MQRLRNYIVRHIEEHALGFIGLGLIVAAVGIIMALTAGQARAEQARIVCGIEASGGGAVSADKINVGGSTIDLAGVGGIVGAGLGCDLQGKTALIGVLARASLMNVSGDLAGLSFESDRLFEVAARAGYRFNDRLSAYVLAGWSWINLDLPTPLGEKNPNGLLLGGGIDFHLLGPWYGRTEYTWHGFSSEGLGGGAKVEPDLHVARAALVVKFNDDADARRVFNDAVDAVVPPACTDSKQCGSGQKRKR